MPDIIAEGGELVEAGVDGEVGIAGGEGVGTGFSGGDIGVGVEGVVALVGGGGDIASGLDEFDAVGSGDQVIEEVITRLRGSWVSVGQLSVDDSAAGVEEIDGYVVDAGVTVVLDAVGVGVFPDIVADGGGNLVDGADISFGVAGETDLERAGEGGAFRNKGDADVFVGVEGSEIAAGDGEAEVEFVDVAVGVFPAELGDFAGEEDAINQSQRG